MHDDRHASLDLQVKPQVVRAAPKTGHNRMQLVEARKLCQYVVAYRAKVLTEVQQQGKTPESARLLHDATLMCFSWGWLPPMRPSCVMSIRSPHAKGKYTPGGADAA